MTYAVAWFANIPWVMTTLFTMTAVAWFVILGYSVEKVCETL